jgi:hypothetical protein
MEEGVMEFLFWTGWLEAAKGISRVTEAIGADVL